MQHQQFGDYDAFRAYMDAVFSNFGDYLTAFGVTLMLFVVSGLASLVLGTFCMILGALCFMIGLLADMISANRKLLERIALRVQRIEHERNERHPSAD